MMLIHAPTLIKPSTINIINRTSHKARLVTQQKSNNLSNLIGVADPLLSISQDARLDPFGIIVRGHGSVHGSYDSTSVSFLYNRNIEIYDGWDVPGATQLIRTSLFSLAADFDNAITAALLAQYNELFGIVICPNVLAAETYT